MGKSILKGENVLEVNFESDRLARFKSYYERAFSGETFKAIEYFETPSETWSEISFFPIKENNLILGTACFSRNITERTIIERKIKKTNQELQTFIYRASHDLRGPLASILGILNICKLENEPKNTYEYLNLIETCTKKLDETLLSLVQSITIKDTKNIRDLIDFEMLIKQTLQKFTYHEGFSKLVIVTKVEPIFNYMSSHYIIESVFQNLIENGIKYQNQTIDDSFLNISVSDQVNHIKIEFRDNGIGMEESIKHKVFDMYYRGTEASKGSGLGLYLVKLGVEKLGGNIYFESSLGKGTRFTIQLPKNNDDAL